MERIYAERISKKFGKITALVDVSLRVKDGDSVGILGPNGAGKSTLLKIVCGLLLPTTGMVRLQGYNPFYERKKALWGVGCIIEEPIIYPSLDPVTYLSYLGELRGMKGPELSRRIKEVLEFMGLAPWSRTKIGRFSRGMRQKLVFTQAILNDPEILVLDEPGLGLDPEAIVNIREYIKKARKEGKTILMASHMLKEVREVCNKVALLNAGHLIKFGNVVMLEKVFAKSLWIELLEPATLGQIKKIEKLPGVESTHVRGKAIEVKFHGSKRDRAELLVTAVKDAGLKVVSFREAIPPIEEVYLSLVRGEDERQP